MIGQIKSSSRVCKHTLPGKGGVDITYIPMRRGFLYLVAVMDWYSRKGLSWRLSNSMEADFCAEALKEAIAKYVKPEIMNSPSRALLHNTLPAMDQGSQFTGFEWINALKDADVKISMDGKGRWPPLIDCFAINC